MRLVEKRAGDRRRLAVSAAALFVGALMLSGCGGAIGQLPLVGAPNAPPPPEVRPEYPPVGTKPGTAPKPMTAAERAALEAELAAAGPTAVQQRRLSISQPAVR